MSSIKRFNHPFCVRFLTRFLEHALRDLDYEVSSYLNYSSIWIMAIGHQLSDKSSIMFSKHLPATDDKMQNVTTAVILTLPQVRDKMVLETILDIEFQDMVGGDKAIFYQVIKINLIVINAILIISYLRNII